MRAGGPRRRAAGALVAAVAVAGLAAPAAVAAGPPPPLSADRSPVDISSTYGSGHFGSWTVDRFGLPAYHYTVDEEHNPIAVNPETGGTDAWHQVGNDYHHAFASNHGYTQLWSQARAYQWVNQYNANYQHYAGGYGYLSLGGGRVLSTLYDDRPAGATTTRDFGVGYFHHAVSTSSVGVDEYVYAPFGSDPVLLHDVTVTNRSGAPEQLSWFEYWDVNPTMQPGFPGVGPRPRGVAAPTWDPATRTLAVDQLPDVTTDDPRSVDTNPLTIFASQLSGPAAGYDTDVDTFFGSGGRAHPAVVAAGRSTNSKAPAWPDNELVPGRTMLALQAPLRLAPGQSVTLRYAYGIAHRAAIAPMVARYRSAPDPLATSEAAWSAWVPKAALGANYAWLARELQWDAYMVRSRATPEEACGNLAILSQGGTYQYDTGVQDAYRDPLQHMLPMVYADPSLARQVILYSAREQPSVGGAIPYGMQALCSTYYFGGESDDLDLWLMWSTAEYVMATRDFAVLDQPVPFADGKSGTLWDHLQLAWWHQENVIGRGIHGLPGGGTMGDWADFSVETNQMTESTLVGAQLAYVYPLLARLAAQDNQRAFASELSNSAAAYRAAVAKEWTGKGWYSRGYSGTNQIGANQIWSLTQPWAILAGIPSPSQSRSLVANFLRYLTGVGAPCGPARTGSSLTPNPNDNGTAGQRCVYPGPDPAGINHDVAAWFALNGPMVMAYDHLDGAVPGANADAWNELLRNTLSALATAHPDHWDGVISADDVCDTWWNDPSTYRCGVPQGGQTFDTQILHQPAWSLYAAVDMAGVQPTATGYLIDPHVPLASYSMRLPNVGVAVSPGQWRGYVTALVSGAVVMQIRLPSGTDPSRVVVFANGRHVPAQVRGGSVNFSLATTAGRPADWAITF
ncbi:MAG TPA: hypothetical protein VFA11_19010 [Acidimicrobiales bacterium]|nr:hypothetical protein [Acidimicrobiales bacterium]